MEQIEQLKLELTFMSTFLQLSYSNLDDFSAKTSHKAQQVDDLVQSVFYESGDCMLVKYDMDHVVPCILENIKTFISSQHFSESSATMTEEQLVELLDLLLVYLHEIPKCCAELVFPSITQYELLQNVCGNLRDFHVLKANGHIEHETIEYVLPQFQLIAERVGLFFFDLLSCQFDNIDETAEADETDEMDEANELDEADETAEANELDEVDELDETDESDETGDSDETSGSNETDDSDVIPEVGRVNDKLAHLLVKIILVALEVMHICSTNLKASKSADVEHFTKQLLGASPDILREYLIHLQVQMVTCTQRCYSS